MLPAGRDENDVCVAFNERANYCQYWKSPKVTFSGPGPKKNNSSPCPECKTGGCDHTDLDGTLFFGGGEKLANRRNGGVTVRYPGTRYMYPGICVGPEFLFIPVVGVPTRRRICICHSANASKKSQVYYCIGIPGYPGHGPQDNSAGTRVEPFRRSLRRPRRSG
eukprot:346738-Rhodomonas_salina.1